MERNKLSRRAFLQTITGGGLGAAGWICAGLFRPGRAYAQEPIPILGAIPLTGPYAFEGGLLRRGHEMAIQQDFNGKVLNRPIKYVIRDTETDAGAATRRVAEAIDTENVRAIIGPWSSGVALAITDVAKQKKRVHFFSGGTQHLAGKDCHRYGFQWAASPYTAAWAVLEYVMRIHPEAKRWYMLTVDYAFGWALEEFTTLIGEKEYGITFVGKDRHVLGEREYSPFITKAAAVQPDVLLLNNFGLDAVQAIREAHAFGLGQDTQIVVMWSSGFEDYIQLTPEIRDGLIIGSNFYPKIDTPVAKRWVQMYQEQFGELPGYAPSSNYSMMRIVLRAIERAGSDEPAAIVKALEGWEFEDLLGKMSIDPHIHQTIRPYFVTRGKAQGQDKLDVADIVHTSDKPMPRALNECKDLGSL